MLSVKNFYQKFKPKNAKNSEEKSLKKNTSGATAIEYGMIAALLSLAILASVKLMGTALKSTFSTLASDIQTIN
jgi:pilus assembly protein Flp/PilA